MSSYITLRNVVRITVEGEAEAVFSIMDIMAKRFTFGNNGVTYKRDKFGCVELSGFINGKLKKKYRKRARVLAYDITDEEDDED